MVKTQSGRSGWNEFTVWMHCLIFHDGLVQSLPLLVPFRGNVSRVLLVLLHGPVEFVVRFDLVRVFMNAGRQMPFADKA